jgi:hypothetical protein
LIARGAATAGQNGAHDVIKSMSRTGVFVPLRNASQTRKV